MATRGRSQRPISLAGVRGFEASARLLSFTLAAAELSLTQSSISRQIRTLESQIGRPLFKRRTRSLELTPAGERFQRVVHASLAEIDRTIAELRRISQRRSIAVTTFASFASLILVPRLPRYSSLHPDVDITIDADDAVRDLEADEFDIALRHQPLDRAPPGAILLAEDQAVPVISPALLAKTGPIVRPADLARTMLLVETSTAHARGRGGWDRWFATVGAPMPDDVPTLSLSFTYQALDAALRGHGMMLAPVFFVREHLERGELVTPIPIRLASTFGYFLIRNRQTAAVPHVAGFTQWLLGALQLQPAPEPAPPGRAGSVGDHGTSTADESTAGR